MRILKLDKKHKELVLIPEKEEDLIFLSIFLIGAKVGLKNIRRVKKYIGDRVVIDKIPIFMKIIVKDTEFDDFRNNLVIKGEVVETEGLTGEHTASIEIGKKIEVYKEFDDEDIKNLKELEKEEKKLLIILIDRDEALIWKDKIIANISNTDKTSKEDERFEDYKGFFSNILRIVKENLEENMIVAGPGFVKEKFAKFLEEKLKIKPIIEHCSSVSISGLKELFSRNVISKVIGKKKIEEEQKLVEKILEMIAKNEPIAYGKEEVKNALYEGNVKKLIISMDALKDKNTFIEVKELIKLAKEINAEIYIVAKFDEAVNTINGFGGVIAIKRW